MSQSAEDLTVVGSVTISVILKSDGTRTHFQLDGLSPEAAIGHITVVSDRLREIVASGWDTDLFDFELHIHDIDCPHCGKTIELTEEDEESEDE